MQGSAILDAVFTFLLNQINTIELMSIFNHPVRFIFLLNQINTKF